MRKDWRRNSSRIYGFGWCNLELDWLVGGVIFNATGSKLSDKADEAYSGRRTEKEVKKIVEYFDELVIALLKDLEHR
ncbi:MAG: hypothetical protein ACLTAI_08295 [Thomasclavelia sp.]